MSRYYKDIVLRPIYFNFMCESTKSETRKLISKIESKNNTIICQICQKNQKSRYQTEKGVILVYAQKQINQFVLFSATVKIFKQHLYKIMKYKGFLNAVFLVFSCSFKN